LFFTKKVEPRSDPGLCLFTGVFAEICVLLVVFCGDGVVIWCGKGG